jgi:hypothetical protein
VVDPVRLDNLGISFMTLPLKNVLLS